MDNATNMKPYKVLTTFVVETLVKKLPNIDADGLDLRFTLGQEKLSNVKNNAAHRFRQAVLDAWPQDDYDYRTDMSATLSKIYDEYFKKSQKKATTLLIFTNGQWGDSAYPAGTDTPRDTQVEDLLVALTKELKDHKMREKRYFTIQFIQIGDRLGEHEPTTKKLKRLDDDLENVYKAQGFRLVESEINNGSRLTYAQRHHRSCAMDRFCRQDGPRKLC